MLVHQLYQMAHSGGVLTVGDLCGGRGRRGIWELVFHKLSFAVNLKLLLKDSLLNFWNHTYLSIPKPLSTTKFHDFMTYHQSFWHSKELYIWILNYQHLVLFVSPKTGNVWKQSLFGFPGENSNNTVEKLDSTLTRWPKLITNESALGVIPWKRHTVIFVIRQIGTDNLNMIMRKHQKTPK